MSSRENSWATHDRFRELAALSASGVLTAQEQNDLSDHLHHCANCREIYRQYQTLGVEVIATTASHDYDYRDASRLWDATAVRQGLFKRVQELSESPSEQFARNSRPVGTSGIWRWAHWAFPPGVAALLLIGVACGAYWLGIRRVDRARRALLSADGRLSQLLSAKRTDADQLGQQAAAIAHLRAQYDAEISQEEKWRAELQRLKKSEIEERGLSSQTISELQSAGASAAERVRELSAERDQLLQQISHTQQALDKADLELTSSRSQFDHVVARVNQLQAEVDDLSSINQDQRRRLDEDEKYLSSNRDIRDLMSARNLYIADVFDVDSSSRTRKPFGRVFYTRGKSLIFYAFDLDRTPTVRMSSAFQVWGQKNNAPAERVKPRSLGILYLDSESNRRWILKSDDPATLDGIDAVFVTVEPHGGSPEPTGKPLLYAQLRRPPNHP